ncbi:MAG: IS110 family transposase [Methanoregula sp.]|nr:IS110 family transposase [Methanoregula sp.]
MTAKRRKVCGIDVHKGFVVAVTLDCEGNSETKKYLQDLDSLTDLREWVLKSNCESVAFESTADYWRPLYAVLEPHIPITVANAYHIKHIPGKKTDITDAYWIAELELNGLISPSRIFKGYYYDLRTLTRYRETLVNNRTDYKNKVHHQLDLCGIRLCKCMKDIFSKTGYPILKGITAKKSQEEILEYLPAKSRKHADKFFSAIPSDIPENNLLVLESALTMIDNINEQIKQVEERIKFLVNQRRHELRILMSIPGVGFIGATTLLAEIGNVHDFSNSDKLAKWAGLTPSVYQSANTNYTGPITKQGSPHLRRILVECSHAAVRSSGTLKNYFDKLRPGKCYKKAIVAVARKLLRIAWHLLVNDEVFIDDEAMSKDVWIPKMPSKMKKIGFEKIIELLSRGAEMIIQEEGLEVMRLKLDT